MGSGQFDSRIDEIQASRDATSQLLEEVEEAKRDLEMEILRRKKIEKVLKKSYLRLKGSPGSETVQTRVNRGFLATMNHEIRTPLNSITGFLALLKQTKLTPEQQEYANAVLSASESLLLLISDILDTSTIEAGQLELGRVPFLLDEVVKDICSTMAIKAHVKGLELNWQIEPGTPLYLVGDAGRLRQVLANLVENAVKFTKKGEVFLRVQKKGSDGHRTTLSFSVVDTGKGVSPGEKEKLFCSFFKDDRSGTKEIFGTGLGLHISKKIVEMMDGEIDHTPNEPEGSVFRFTIKLEEEIRKKEEKPRNYPGLDILILDGNSRTRSVLKEELEAGGARVTEATSSNEALTECAEAKRRGRPYDTLFLESTSGRTDGFEVVRSLKSEGGEVPKIVMLVTTNQLARQHTRMKNLDIAHHLIKPVDPDRLLETLFALSSGELPVQKSGAPAPEKGSFQNAGPDKPLIQILLADDNRDNQKIVGLFLKHQNYCLDVVDNGLQAVEAAREKKYDLILMDIAMPVMDGYNAVKNIRKIELARKTPVIALTARAFSDDKEKWEESGFDGHISKPLNLKSFRRLVEEALEKGESFCSGR